MGLSKFSTWLTIVPSVGVLIGVFLVVYELQQNRIAIEGQTRSDISSLSFDSLQRWAESPEIISAFTKIENGEDLTQEERLTMRFVLSGELRRWENVYYQYERGLFDDSEFFAQSQVWRFRLNSPIYEGVWNPNTTTFSANFIEFVNSLIE